MESTTPFISSLDTKIAYIDYEDMQKPDKQREAIESLKHMRFLIIKNVPGVVEVTRKLYDLIFDFPRLFAEKKCPPDLYQLYCRYEFFKP
jgi:hypothetical protein